MQKCDGSLSINKALYGKNQSIWPNGKWFSKIISKVCVQSLRNSF